MAKRKTRQQKIIADLRRQLSSSEIEQIKIKEPQEKPTTKYSYEEKKVEIKATQHLMYTNPYLSKDLIKTAFLTTGIVLGQLILFYLFRQHILILPGISY
jgi:hypothetical protein